MENSKSSFLVVVDDKFNINMTFWYEPAYLISPYQKSLKDLIDERDWKKLEKRISQAFMNEEILSCEESFRLSTGESEVSLCMLKMHDQVLVHGVDGSLLCGGPSCEVIRHHIHKFMNVIKDSESAVFLTSDNDRMVREQFEEIQRLNSNHLNMQRQIQKANITMNQLNVDLTNRLVKDSLTGLVSRYQYREEIELLISENPSHYGIFAFIDLDDFKSVNDTYGHRAGDVFLKEFADRLVKLPFEHMICMRIAGDEFGVYIHGYDAVTFEEIGMIWKQMKDTVLHKPIKISGTELPVSFSVGMSVYNKDTTEIYDLIEHADFAMYEAKNSGKNGFSFFNAEHYKDKKTFRL
ncbi:MAG TPA: GGDEF domain-containing protein [Proteiniclasticum sp.]|nr:GGDEF domain-containing protein [Proteiniclasticum sp.]